MRNTFRIHFYINRSKKEGGKVPVMGRITIKGTIAQFSCRCSIPEELWSVSRNMAIGRSAQALDVNMHLENIRAQIICSYNKLFFSEKHVTARMVKEEFTGTGNEYKTILEYLGAEIQTFRGRVGKDRAKKTLQKMLSVQKHITEFIRKTYHTTDLYLHEIDKQFIISYSRYLQSLGLAQSTIWVYNTFLKKVLDLAYSNGYIPQNPFANIKIQRGLRQRNFLTEEEVKQIINLKTDNKNLALARDVFLFCCFTGLSFIDVKELKKKNLSI